MEIDKPKTRMELLMKLTGISGKILSQSLHVDMSLISRWKNGLRSIGKNTEQLEKVCDFFINENKGT